MHYDDLLQKLSDGRWIPCTPGEIAAALQNLAGSIDGIYDVGCNSDPSLHSLREHVLALESLIVGREVSFLADLDDDPGYSMSGRAEFQRLYQRFEEQRRAGEDAGLHQRLREVEDRLGRLEARSVADQEAVDEVINGPRIDHRMHEEGWIPTTAAEVGAVLLELSSSIEDAHNLIGNMDNIGGDNYFKLVDNVPTSLRDHIRALEARVYGAPHKDRADAKADAALIAAGGPRSTSA